VPHSLHHGSEGDWKLLIATAVVCALEGLEGSLHTHEGAYRRGREQHLSDIKEPKELDEALYYASVLAAQAGIRISDEMNHPEHDHSTLIESLRQKMTDPGADPDSADS